MQRDSSTDLRGRRTAHRRAACPSARGRMSGLISAAAEPKSDVAPTFRDAPWERDERKRQEDELNPARRGQLVTAAARARSGSRLHAPQGHRRTLVGAGQLLAVVVLVVFGAQAILDRSRSAPTVAVAPALPTSASSPVAAAPTAVASPKPDLGSVTKLQSRVLNGTIEVWGTTDAADGASIGLLIRTVGGSWTRLPDMPASGGRFFGRHALPQHLLNRRLQLRSRVRA